MKIKKELLNELIKLNKKEWDNLKITIDFLYALERDAIEKEIHLNPKNIEKKLSSCPVPIQIQPE